MVDHSIEPDVFDPMVWLVVLFYIIIISSSIEHHVFGPLVLVIYGIDSWL